MVYRWTCLFLVVMVGCSPHPYFKDKGLQKQVVEVQKDMEYCLYFVGDAGNTDTLTPALKGLETQLQKDTRAMRVFFLGDNIYFLGLPDSGDAGYEDAKRKLEAQLGLLKRTGVRGTFIPGNHDWSLEQERGLRYVLNQERFVRESLGDSLSFLPGGGCPGPVVMELGTDGLLVVLDTEWWIYPHAKPDTNACPYGNRSLFIDRLRSLLGQNKEKWVVVLGHHPVYASSAHGGKFSWRDHLFPLRVLKDKLWLPLPVLGSIFVLVRRLAAHPSDLWHPDYRSLRDSLLSVFSEHPRLVYIAGHDHTLQYRKDAGQHYIISGSGSKRSEVVRSKKWEFLYSEYGFVRIVKLPNGIEAEFWVCPVRKQAYVVYSVRLF